MNDLTAPTTPVYKNAKLLLLVTVVVVLVAAGLVAYFLLRNKQSTQPQKETSSQQPTTPAQPSDTSLAKASEELKSIDIKQLKAAVAELKTTLSAFR